MPLGLGAAQASHPPWGMIGDQTWGRDYLLVCFSARPFLLALFVRATVETGRTRRQRRAGIHSM